jgi:hypothetical protein
MESLRSATLVLRTGELVAGSTTAFGTCNTNITNFTWSNLNLRTILGDLYDKYDLFNICLSNITQATGGGANTLAAAPFGTTTNGINDDVVVEVMMSGLPFINQTYSTTDGCNTNVAVLTNYIFSVASTNTVNYNNGTHCLTFSKQQDQVNLNIYYQRIFPVQVNGVYTYNPQTVNPFPNVIFKFKIYGIEKTDLRNGGRIF